MVKIIAKRISISRKYFLCLDPVHQSSRVQPVALEQILLYLFFAHIFVVINVNLITEKWSRFLMFYTVMQLDRNSSKTGTFHEP